MKWSGKLAIRAHIPLKAKIISTVNKVPLKTAFHYDPSAQYHSNTVEMTVKPEIINTCIIFNVWLMCTSTTYFFYHFRRVIFVTSVTGWQSFRKGVNSQRKEFTP